MFNLTSPERQARIDAWNSKFDALRADLDEIHYHGSGTDEEEQPILDEMDELLDSEDRLDSLVRRNQLFWRDWNNVPRRRRILLIWLVLSLAGMLGTAFSRGHLAAEIFGTCFVAFIVWVIVVLDHKVKQS
jgi:hypothetical protein